jgi:hypothetical protein
MATTAPKPYVVPGGTVTAKEEGIYSGWVTFAGIAFLIAAFANLFWGLGALAGKAYLDEGGLLYSTLNTWGWVSVIWGAVVLVGAILLFAEVRWAPVLGIVLASLSCVFWLFALPVLPLYAMTAIVIDVFVIYGLLVHGMATR